ncbi:MAG: hypothetical protein ACQKBY_08820 [Verrucomicrobiales bacterium]
MKALPLALLFLAPLLRADDTIILDEAPLLCRCFSHIFDIPAIDDSDLILPERVVQKEDNAYFLIEQLAKESLTQAERKELAELLNAQEWDQNQARALFTKHYDLQIAPLLRISLLDGYQEMRAETLIDDIPKNIVQIRVSTQLLTLAHRYYRHDNQPEKGDEILRSFSHASELLLENQGTLVSALIAQAIYQTYLKELAWASLQRNVTLERARLYPELIPQINYQKTFVESPLKEEYRTLVNLCDLVATGRLIGGNLLNQMAGNPAPVDEKSEVLGRYFTAISLAQKNRTRAASSAFTRSLLARSKLNHQQLAKLEPLAKPFPNHPWQVFHVNLIGKLLMKLSHPTQESYLSRIFLIETHEKLTRIALVLRAYQLEHEGALPETLAALSPRYLAQIPLDPYVDKPFHYDPARKRLWSVGSDHESEGGLSPEALAKARMRDLEREPTIDLSLK